MIDTSREAISWAVKPLSSEQTRTLRVQYTVSYGKRAPARHVDRLEVWQQTERYCPQCGQQGIWQQVSAPDLDVDAWQRWHDVVSLCTGCQSGFTLPLEVWPCRRRADRQRLKLLKARVRP